MRIILQAIVFTIITTAFARAQPSPAGQWLTEDGGGVIEVAACGNALCGRIVGMAEPVLPDGRTPVDYAGQPKCGLTILRDAVESDPGVWTGRITNPEDGSVWHCTLSVDEEGRLHLRGYVLVPLLGRTQIWRPYTGSIGPGCRMG
ncbi:DUF2147 domain-containing protein [Limobrevibacterium gyesilva]|uniref:DUF2147 domain-containing protein n=1 Tax=Limobrevibacterium gyesilva TaxID=2991712 RepID=A0AA42CDV5_9PROT|nr:DUF2147 domain-containing protein [Limobrevibacterium gyesilva]MCW3474424.1 DUF2147 domain-containing protein [Limobrevibacterium gyesilva]